ncbi:MAG: hypothetical protein PHO28_04620 [Candidatus Pacebacteria bacterium]|nr:hypothetical protein [Candidatus Paceibacterota bacterium]
MRKRVVGIIIKDKRMPILGKAKYYKKGEWLNYVKKLKENKGLPAKGAIVIKV